MFFASPIWLLGLLPWAAVVVYWLIGRGQLAVVPFLRFWEGKAAVSRRRNWRVPPMFVWLVLVTMLLAIVAAAEPMRRDGAAVIGDVSIVLDRGSTMARPEPGGEVFRGVIDRCDQILGPMGGMVSITPVPGRQVEVAGSAWVTTAKGMPPTAIQAGLDQAVVDRLRQTRGLVVVLSDQKLETSDSRIVQIVPQAPAPTVAITLLAAKSQPRPQVMVRLENHSELKSIHLRVTSGDVKVDRQVELGPNGKSQDEFFEPASLGTTVTAEIEPRPNDDPWSDAFLVRQSAGIHPAVIGEVPQSVRRMVEVYSKDRPAEPGSSEVFVSDHQLAENQPGIWIDPTDSAGASAASVRPHAVTRDVKSWPAKGTAVAVPPGFSAVVSAGEDPIVAVREQPARQVWIHGDFQSWEKTTDFVIFFGNALDWIAESDQQYVSIPPAILGDDWKRMGNSTMPANVPAGAWPGLYRSAAGRLLAVNASDYPSGASAQDILPQHRAPQRLRHNAPLLPAFICVALACLLAAVFFWPAGSIMRAPHRAGRFSG